jgi:hypothetical protein
MSTFLQLAQRVYIEGGISGQITSTQNQTGEALRVVTWVNGAYREILNSDQFTFGFIRKEVHVQLTPNQGSYNGVLDFQLDDLVQWDTDTMRVSINEDRSDETFLINMRWPAFRDYWRFSTRRTTASRPLNCSVNQDTNLEIGPVPADPYWLTMQYLAAPPDLLSDTDVPVIPLRWQMCIVWRALRHYGMFESAPEVVMRADAAYNEIMLRMTLDQSPQIVGGAPLC